MGLRTHLSGDFKRLMLTMIDGSRPEEQEVDLEEAKEDAQVNKFLFNSIN